MLKVLIILKIYIFSFMLSATEFYDFSFKSINGEEIHFRDFENKVVLLVNTASMCGFTKQYDGLQRLYENYKEKGLILIGLPSNSFKQEYINEDKVKDFCETNFNITFPITTIIEVIGENKHPFYKWLEDKYNTKPRWNFYKYLFDKEGKMIRSFSSLTKPNSNKVVRMIESELAV